MFAISFLKAIQKICLVLFVSCLLLITGCSSNSSNESPYQRVMNNLGGSVEMSIDEYKSFVDEHENIQYVTTGYIKNVEEGATGTHSYFATMYPPKSDSDGTLDSSRSVDVIADEQYNISENYEGKFLLGRLFDGSVIPEDIISITPFEDESKLDNTVELSWDEMTSIIKLMPETKIVMTGFFIERPESVSGTYWMYSSKEALENQDSTQRISVKLSVISPYPYEGAEATIEAIPGGSFGDEYRIYYAEIV